MSEAARDPVASVALPTHVDMAATIELREQLLAMAGAPRIEVDGAAVERIGTPAIQVLLAATRGAAAEGRSLKLRSPSSAMRRALEDVGLLKRA
ncbi:STAS domain-containing protein [Methyloraptor flagellatus]|jgi:anti-anti-sigma regulatory factor|uniref:STAS domain-containing protein n=1 Tax=Methyloraptor flagellatus TaxID=3162530 RepID=A0AAU7XAB0_9HYPH